MNKTTETTNNELADRVFELLAEGWPLRSMTLLELVAATDCPQEQVLAVLRQNASRLRRCWYSYGIVYLSRDEIARRALAYIGGQGWCRQADIERAVGLLRGVYSTLDGLAEIGLLDARDTPDGAIWRLPGGRADELGIECWSDSAVTIPFLRGWCRKLRRAHEARVYI